jgi:hypothetical protein
MQMKLRPRHLLLSLLLASAPASCDRQPTSAAAPGPQPPAARPVPAPRLGVVPAADESGGPDGGAATAAESLIVGHGQWTETKQYKFRFERIAACGAPTTTVGPAQPTAASGVGAFKGETTWVGALFSVEAKDDSMFVSPRDLELRRGGVVLNARHINQPLLPECKPALAARQLKIGEAVTGFALFEVPKSFRTTTDDPIVLAYRPTRWGGSRRVEVPIRECLDACPASSSQRSGKTAGRSAPISRPKP